MNLIPEGALHARKHGLDSEDITKKGIPVITVENIKPDEVEATVITELKEGDIIQHAEIEVNEIIFTKEVTDKIEKLRKEYKSDGKTKKEKDEIALKLGELITFEIIENTDDRTNLIDSVE